MKHAIAELADIEVERAKLRIMGKILDLDHEFILRPGDVAEHTARRRNLERIIEELNNRISGNAQYKMVL